MVKLTLSSTRLSAFAVLSIIVDDLKCYFKLAWPVTPPDNVANGLNLTTHEPDYRFPSYQSQCTFMRYLIRIISEQTRINTAKLQRSRSSIHRQPGHLLQLCAVFTALQRLKN